MSERERASIESELTPPFTVVAPHVQTSPFVFCSPHSGRIYPKAFLESSRLDAKSLRKSEDCYVDQLFSDVARLGVPLISARFPRAYLDVNREPFELDPELFSEPLPAYANTQSVRVVGGLGTIARIVADSEDIYREQLSLAAALQRIDRLYKPFHQALGALLEDTRRRFGIAILIDCHSMPSASIGQPSMARPDFVLGDRFGASCDAKVTRFLKEDLMALGYEVHLNRPYAGGFITEHYGRPARGLHTLQVEVNRALYVNEATFELTDGFASLKSDLGKVLARLMKGLPEVLVGRAAAE
jgi:N-formylglutamate amidohydrolase